MPKEVNERLNHFVITSPPLSILSIGTYLTSKGFDVRIIDMEIDYGLPLNKNGEKTLIDRFIGEISNEKIDWIGFTNTTPDQCEASINLSFAIKNMNSNIPVIFGGYHATINAKELLEQYNCIDAIVVGEGEQASLKIHQHIINNQSFQTTDIKNIAFQNNGKVVFSKRDLLISLNKIPALRFELLDNIDRYNLMSLLSTRGCPYNCSYCIEKVMRNRYRIEPINKIITQIKTMADLNSTKNLAIHDPLFGLNKKRLKKICEIIKDANYKFIYETRVDIFSPSMIPEIKKAGGEVMLLGLESTSEDTLLRMNKVKDEKQYNKYIKNTKKLIDACFENDITPFISTMFGYPGDVKRDLQKTIDFLKQINQKHSNYYNKENDGVGIIVYPHIVSIIPQSQLSFDVNKNKYKEMSHVGGGLFRFSTVINPSLDLNSQTVLDYKQEAESLSIITQKTMKRIECLMYHNFKKMLMINSELKNNNILLTKDIKKMFNDRLLLKKT